jgi:hypothetical protein
MKRNNILTQPLDSSFLSCEKDTETILRKLFVESQPYSDMLKKLLIVQSSDCLTGSYDVSTYNLSRLIQDKYIALTPKIPKPEHDQMRSIVVLSFDKFVPNLTNPEFRNCMIHFDVICHHDAWTLQNFQQRPFKILGCIDGILNGARLSGIGQLNFVGCVFDQINENWSEYTLTYQAIHGSDDEIPVEE